MNSKRIPLINIYRSLVLLTLLFSFHSIQAQCTVTTNPATAVIDCGDSLDINVYGSSGSGGSLIVEDFNSGILSPGWSTPSTILYNNPCSPSPDGSPTCWFGANNIRSITSPAIDVSCGGTVCFDLDFAGDEDATNCEDPDAINEGVYFSYSTDGSTWITIFFFQPNSSNTGPYYSWNNYCFSLPAGAWSTNTFFKWDQPFTSSTYWDHWGLDNIQIIPVNCSGDPGYYFEWNGMAGDQDSTVAPISNAVYNIIYTNGIDDTCSTTTTVDVNPFDPGFNFNPTTFCYDAGTILPASVDNPGGVFTANPALSVDPSTGEIVLSGAASGNYDITYSSANSSCSNDSTVTISISNPSIDAGTDVTVCEGDQVTLTAINPDGAAISWSNGITDGVAFNPTPGITVYTVTASDGSCVKTDDVSVTMNMNPTISGTVTNDTGSGNGSIDITANGNGPFAFNWSNSASTEDISNLTAGTYEVTITDNNGCQATETFVVISTIGIDERDKNKPSIYPNPGDGIYTIELTGKSEVTVSDASGKIILKTTENSTIILNLTGYEAGVYLVTIDQNGRTYTERIVHQPNH